VSLNWKEIDRILDELDLAGSRIRKVFQGDFDVLALEVYGKAQTRTLVISLTPGGCRINQSFRPVPKSAKPLRFAEFLKSRIVNGRIEDVSQLGDNRIVRFLIRRGEILYRVYARLWSNAANVIVTGEDGVILDAMKRLPRRGEVTGGSYRPEETLDGKAGENTGGAVSETARERAAKTDGKTDGKKAEADDKYVIRELPGDGSFNEKIDAFYAERGGELSLEKLRERAAKLIGGSINRLEASLDRLREKEAEYKNAARWKEYGDIIMTNASAVVPGAAWLEAADFFSPENNTIRIELDGRKSPVENAELCYEKYRRGKSGLNDVGEEIAGGEAELARLRETEKRLFEETNPLVLKALLKKIRPGAGITDAGAGEAAKKRPGLSFRDGDWLILVGRDAKENDELLRRHVRGNDIWIHARDYSGAYVFIKCRPGKTAPLDILLDGGNLALFYSKGRNNGAGDCYYTQVKYLRRMKNGPRGKVIPTQEKNIAVKLDRKRLKKLEEARIRH
jgi:predicted ribosome quality control (RQC) complex YloA/Tae2 family protein